MHLRSAFLLLSFWGTLSTPAQAVTLDEAYSNFKKCEFKNFYYADWMGEKPHVYFSERKLTPYAEKDGLYYFKVSDTLFGLPVSELWVPGTWDYHVVIFNLPLSKARSVLRSKFGSEFRPSKKSDNGEVPALEEYQKDRSKSVFYCKETEY